MKRIFQLICLLLAANCVAACGNTENDAPLGPIGETPAEDDPDAEHIYLWPEGNMPTITDYTINNGNYQDDLRAGNIPPTFYTYGTEDPFYRQFIANANAAREAGVQVEEHVLDGWPHGFGVQGEWTTWFDSFLTQIMSH